MFQREQTSALHLSHESLGKLSESPRQGAPGHHHVVWTRTWEAVVGSWLAGEPLTGKGARGKLFLRICICF